MPKKETDKLPEPSSNSANFGLVDKAVFGSSERARVLF